MSWTLLGWLVLGAIVLVGLRAGHWIAVLLGLCLLVFAISVQSRTLAAILFFLAGGLMLHG